MFEVQVWHARLGATLHEQNSLRQLWPDQGAFCKSLLFRHGTIQCACVRLEDMYEDQREYIPRQAPKGNPAFVNWGYRNGQVCVCVCVCVRALWARKRRSFSRCSPSK